MKQLAVTTRFRLGLCLPLCPEAAAPGSRLRYWPRSWAACALAYLGDDGAGPWLVDPLDDEHWRVRMTAAQTLSRLQILRCEEELARLLDDEHQRVRAAAAAALDLPITEPAWLDRVALTRRAICKHNIAASLKRLNPPPR